MPESDDFVLAKRMSLATGIDQCFASSSDAPHAPLQDLLGRLERTRIHLAKLDRKEAEIDAGKMARVVENWADGVQMIILTLDAAEQDRSEDVFNAIDWYNKNLADAERDMRSTYLKALKQKEKKWEAAMQQQKQMYESKQTVAGQQRMSAQHSDMPALDPFLPTTKEKHQESHGEANHSETIQSLSQQHEAEVAFLKRKIERLADQNDLLRKSQPDSTAVKQVMDREIEQIKKTYQFQIDRHKAKVEYLAENNAELRKQLKQRIAQEKRKAEGSLARSEGVGSSPKKLKD